MPDAADLVKQLSGYTQGAWSIPTASYDAARREITVSVLHDTTGAGGAGRTGGAVELRDMKGRVD